MLKHLVGYVMNWLISNGKATQFIWARSCINFSCQSCHFSTIKWIPLTYCTIIVYKTDLYMAHNFSMPVVKFTDFWFVCFFFLIILIISKISLFFKFDSCFRIFTFWRFYLKMKNLRIFVVFYQSTPTRPVDWCTEPSLIPSGVRCFTMILQQYSS